MKAPYPSQVYERLAFVNRLSLGWLMNAIERNEFWHDSENRENISLADSDDLGLLVSDINLLVGERTMVKAAPSIAGVCAKLQHWAAERPGRLQVYWACESLLQAVVRAESSFRDAR